MIIEDENTSDFSVKVVGSQEEEATNQEEQQENQAVILSCLLAIGTCMILLINSLMMG